MCQEKPCPHKDKAMCSCIPILKCDPLDLLIHAITNMRDAVWELEYMTLTESEPRRLCVSGRCRHCGGRLCRRIGIEDDLFSDDLLAAVYRHLYQYHHAGGEPLSREAFRERFVQLFHPKDRDMIRDWLDRPENRCIHTMYRESSCYDRLI